MSYELLTAARIPSGLWRATLEKIPEGCAHREALARARHAPEAMVAEGVGLYLYGGPQTGKSAAAAIVAKAALAKGLKVGWVESAIFPEIALGRVALADVVSLPGPGLVVLDAVGQEYPEGPGTAGLGRVVSTLLDSGYTLILTSLREYQETADGTSWFRQRYGAETWEKLRGRVWPVRCGGHDWGAERVAGLREFFGGSRG